LGLIVRNHGREEHVIAAVIAQLSDLAERIDVRFGHAEWAPGESGDDVIRRARNGIGPTELARA
jgi:hypothetical protein